MVTLCTKNAPIKKFDTAAKQWEADINDAKLKVVDYGLLNIAVCKAGALLQDFKNFSTCQTPDGKVKAMGVVSDSLFSSKVFTFKEGEYAWEPRSLTGVVNGHSGGFGFSVCLVDDGKTLFASAPGNYGSKGVVYVFHTVLKDELEVWKLDQELTSDLIVLGGLFGSSISYCGGYLAVAQKYRTTAQVLVFKKDSGGKWVFHSAAHREAAGHGATAIRLLDGGNTLITANDTGDCEFYTRKGHVWQLRMTSREYKLENVRYSLNVIPF